MNNLVWNGITIVVVSLAGVLTASVLFDIQTSAWLMLGALIFPLATVLFTTCKVRSSGVAGYDGLETAKPQDKKLAVIQPGRESNTNECPRPEFGWITIGAQNNAIHPGHHYYLFHIVPGQPDLPFVFEESVGGGHTAGGGAIQLGLLELDGWSGNWRQHVVKAGCPWIVEIIDSRPDDNTPGVINAIVSRFEIYKSQGKH